MGDLERLPIYPTYVEFKVLVTGVVILVVTEERPGTQNRWCGIPLKSSFIIKSFLVGYTTLMLLVMMLLREGLCALIPRFHDKHPSPSEWLSWPLNINTMPRTID
jgi:hypothetical protein